ncbi:uncharacterized protein LOC111341880 isoform X2 [Stylophora pistillata]|uniref:uncharacterized protein LOC111341880 isoform X2 n=1 Tax=Stylophora pistillata TaxID=50429 RepID=UPI000C052E45|nr:uncharacterized protein LOC111341880 isoform X2 [Stylophora pistillata]
MSVELLELKTERGTPIRFHLFNCDRTYNLDVVENLLSAVNEKSTGLDIDSEQKYFRLPEMSNLCDTLRSGPPMDFAVFAVNANESRLSINEKNAGIGYGKFYRALLKATGERVIVVIGADDNYNDAAEEQRSLLSRWARRKVSSQFNEEFMDGSKGFILSWNKAHRVIHEEALQHFLDPSKKNHKFVLQKKDQSLSHFKSLDQKQMVTDGTATVVTVRAESQVSRDTIASTNGEEDYLGMENKKLSVGYALGARPKQGSNSLFQSCASFDTETHDHKKKAMDVSESGKRMEAARQESFDSMNTNPLSPIKKVLILGRDQSDVRLVNELFADDVLSKVCIFNGSSEDPGRDSSIFDGPLKSCFIVVEARILKDELQFKSQTKSNRCMLESAKRNTEKLS